MLPVKEKYNISSKDVSELLKIHYPILMQSFLESQSSFLCNVYKRYKSIETANVIICFARNVHLEILRQREKDLNFDVSIESFWNNFNNIKKPIEKISNIVRNTGIPKETVRRKIKTLVDLRFLSKDLNEKGYYWSVLPKEKDEYFEVLNNDTKNLARFIAKFVNNLNLNFDIKIIEEEIKSQFSFYWYHYLSCQLEWLKMWQLKFKDNELLLISLQATIPSLQFIDKTIDNLQLKDIHKIIGNGIKKDNLENCSVSATAVSSITGIPRATCIRKLNKLVNLGFLVRINKNKRYLLNQITDERTKFILNNENVISTINTFSNYIAIIVNSLKHNKL